MADSKSKLAAEAQSLDHIAAGIARCRGCRLWERATQAVGGEGSPKSRIIFVGEQPGDQEDLAGKPFVGPAGRVLDEALEEAGVDRRDVYVTNAVKHFSWEPRGKRRMHKTPAQQEIAACQDWLAAEIRLIAPDLIVALGATAVRALLGPGVRVLVNRGKFLPSDWGVKVLVTVHPSSILRVPPEDRDQAFDAFVKDLAKIQRAFT
ncbi:MAG TPA: UdgX family uracil-DNA binding protein [Casimicrobiaceae bacterium]|nr:UdgX family uracil-DNA binding protein [Casimicrobiaceae bacterium]